MVPEKKTLQTYLGKTCHGHIEEMSTSVPEEELMRVSGGEGRLTFDQVDNINPFARSVALKNTDSSSIYT